VHDTNRRVEEVHARAREDSPQAVDEPDEPSARHVVFVQDIRLAHEIVLEILHRVVHRLVARNEARLPFPEGLVPAHRTRLEPRLDVLLREPLEPHRHATVLG